jgi:putative DNA primase/helicase
MSDDNNDHNVVPIRERAGPVDLGRDRKKVAPRIGQIIVDAHKKLRTPFLFCKGTLRWHREGLWEAYVTKEDVKRKLDVEIARAFQELGMEKMTDTRLVNETRNWLERKPDLHNDRIKWDAHGKIATIYHLVDPETLEVRNYRPQDYATTCLSCGYHPDAQCPTWRQMVDDAFQGDQATIQFVQEVLGTSLILEKPRGLMRALVFLGPSNSGKSNLIRVLAGLLSRKVNSTPLAALENAHGLSRFLTPDPWVLHEAFEQSKWELSAKAKALLSGDEVQVNLKNGPMIDVRWRSAAFWGTNHPPQFKEASEAMANRIAIVNVTKVYDPGKVEGVAKFAMEEGYSSPADYVLEMEKEGVLNWALEGLQRAMARGHLVMTGEMKESLAEMLAESNIATGFVKDCCGYDPDAMVSAMDFHAAFVEYWRESNGSVVVPGSKTLGKAVAAMADPKIVTGLRHNGIRMYVGIKLSDAGMDFWNAYANSAFASGSTARISERPEQVNRALPESMVGHPKVAQLQRPSGPSQGGDGG